jgi:hypothetical protein
MGLLNPPEPEVVINGVELSEGEALTLRVALETFALQLSDEEFCTELGEQLSKNYRARLQDIRAKIFARRT